MPQPLSAWRSLLYVPVNVERFVHKAADSGADGIVLDLEDSIPPAEKASARDRLAGCVDVLGPARPDVLVRINSPWRLCVRDLEAAVRPAVRALVCPKIQAPYHIRAIGEVVGELEQERGLELGTIRLVALVEDARAFFQMEAIARAEARLVAVTLGGEDLAAELGIDPANPESGLLQAKMTTVMANRAAGLEPIGLAGSIANFRDLDAFRATARRSRAMGFVGASCIHPAQVAVLNEAFTPSADETAWAREAKEAFEAAVTRGSASVAVGGAMVDIPVYQRALRILARAEAAAARG